jgi:zinc protease
MQLPQLSPKKKEKKMKKKSKFYLGLILIFLFIPFSAYAQNIQVDSSGFAKAILDNKTTLLIQEDFSSNLIVANVLLKGGLLVENKDKSGLGNLCARMILKGNQNMSAEQVVEEIDFLGATLYSGLAEDYSYFTLTVIAENFKSAFDILTNSFIFPAFPQNELEKLKKEILGQIKSEDDNMFGLGGRVFFKALYGDTAYGLPLLGNEESIPKISLPDVKTYYEKYYKSENVVISIVGNLKAPELFAYVNDKLKGLPKGKEKINPFVFKKVSQPKVFVEKQREQSIINLGYPLPWMDSTAYPVIALMNQMMGGGINSRLWFLRQKEKLAYSVFSQFNYYRYGGAFREVIATANEKRETALNSLRRETERLKNEPIPQEEFETAQLFYRTNLIRNLESKANRSRYLARFVTVELGPKYIYQLLEDVKNVTPYQIKSFAQAYFIPENEIEAIVGKK